MKPEKIESLQNTASEVLEDLNMGDLFNSYEDGENMNLLAKHTNEINLSSNNETLDVTCSKALPVNSVIPVYSGSKHLNPNHQVPGAEKIDSKCVVTAKVDIKLGKSSPSVQERGTQSKSDSLYVPITKFVTENTDLSKLVSENFLCLEETTNVPKTKHSNCDNATSATNEDSNTLHEYCDTQNELDGATDCKNTNTCANACRISSQPDKNAYTSAKSSQYQTRSDIMLTGLHTCGDLAPSMMRIFLSNEKAQILCNVGCCYHLLNEEFSGDKNGELKKYYARYLRLIKYQ